jgi:hypothetical protein
MRRRKGHNFKNKHLGNSEKCFETSFKSKKISIEVILYFRFPTLPLG